MQYPLTASLNLNNEPDSIVTTPQNINCNQPFYRNGLKNLHKRQFNAPIETFVTSGGKLLIIDQNNIYDANDNLITNFNSLGIKSKTFYSDYYDVYKGRGLKKVYNGVQEYDLATGQKLRGFSGTPTDAFLTALYVRETEWEIIYITENNFYLIFLSQIQFLSPRSSGPLSIKNLFAFKQGNSYWIVSQGNNDVRSTFTNSIYKIQNNAWTYYSGKYIAYNNNYNLYIVTGQDPNFAFGQIENNAISWKSISRDSLKIAPGLIHGISSNVYLTNDKLSSPTDILNLNITTVQNKEEYLNFNSSINISQNIRALYNAGVLQTFSFYDYPQNQGVILVPFGLINSNYFPEVRSIDNNELEIFYRDQNNNPCVIILGIPDKRIIKIHDKLYKINTCSINNLLFEENELLTVEPGSLDWNNRLLIQPINTSGTNSPFSLNSGYNVNYESNGGLYHSISLNSNNINLTISQTPGIFLEQLIFSNNFDNGNIDNNYSLDIFFSRNIIPSYLMSCNSRYLLQNSIKKNELNNFVYPTPDITNIASPLPIYFETEDTSNTNSLVKLGFNQQAFLQQYKNYPMDGFYFSSIIYRNYTSFTILGTYNYLYDGKYIFEGNRQGNTSINLTEVCKAYNYIFLGNSYTDAYFYNRFDKSLYLFSGDRRLTKLLSLSNREEPIAYKFSSFDNQMFLMFKNEIVIISPTGQLYNFSIDNYKNMFTYFIETNDGCWTAGKHDNILLTYEKQEPLDSPYVIDSIVPIFLETEYQGYEGVDLVDMESIVIRVHAEDTHETKRIILGIETINSDTKQMFKKSIEINHDDWDITKHMNIKIAPQYVRGLGHKLIINCPNELQICNIEWNTTPFGKQTLRGAVTA